MCADDRWVHGGGTRLLLTWPLLVLFKALRSSSPLQLGLLAEAPSCCCSWCVLLVQEHLILVHSGAAAPAAPGMGVHYLFSMTFAI